jgi:hypothetical protein
MKVNWRKGLNRIFALAVLGWAIYVVFVYPFQQRDAALRNFRKDTKDCYSLLSAWEEDSARGLPGMTPDALPRAVEDCNHTAFRTMDARIDSTSLSNALPDRWHALGYALGVLVSANPPAMQAPHGAFDWIGAAIPLGVIVMPPALVYGLVEVVWRTGRWVPRGFRQMA